MNLNIPEAKNFFMDNFVKLKKINFALECRY